MDEPIFQEGALVKGCFGEARVMNIDRWGSVRVLWKKQTPLREWANNVRPEALELITGPVQRDCPECEEDDYFFDDDYICAPCRMELE
jgi:hypothetical protein